MTESSNEARVERMLAEGRLTAEEAERLRRSLRQGAPGATTRPSTRRVTQPHRPVWLLLGLLTLFFVLGATTHWLLVDLSGDAVTGSATAQAPARATAEGRLIDLSELPKERSRTMTRSLPLSIAIVVTIVASVLGALVVVLHNGLVSAREQVNAGWSQVENVYQRRLDLVPLLVDAVQSYTDHERETLTALTRARADAIKVSRAIGAAPASLEQLHAIEASQGELRSALSRLLAVVENYPELKASRNFLSLQDQIEGTENRVTMERRNYNEFSRRYNTRLQTFPGNIVAELMGFESKPYFEAEPGALRGVKDAFRDKES